MKLVVKPAGKGYFYLVVTDTPLLDRAVGMYDTKEECRKAASVVQEVVYMTGQPMPKIVVEN